MPYGTIKVDTVTFTNAGVDKSVTLSGLVQNPVFSGNVTVTGTLSGVTVTGTTANFTSGNFTNISGGTHTITSGVFAAGSAASPSITFTGDLNTGIYSPGADQVAISTNGTGRLFVDASGNVGVGTSTVSDFGGYQTLGINDTVGGFLEFRSSNTLSHGIVGDSNYLFVKSITNLPLLFGTNDTERLRITSAGLVGVGTSAPGAALDVIGSTYIRGTSGGRKLEIGPSSAAFKIAADTTSTGLELSSDFAGGYMDLQVAGSSRVYITNLGRVGVGTTSPSAPFVVSASSAAGVEVTAGSAAASSGTLIEHYNRATSAYVQVRTLASIHRFDIGTSEALRIDSSGRVGIGTSSPGALLHVASSSTTAYNGTAFNASRLYLSGGAGTGAYNSIGFTNSANAEGLIGFVQNASGYGDFVVQSYAGSYGEKLRITSAGNVGIGTTSPTGTLQIQPANSNIPASALVVRQNNGADTSQNTFSIEIDPVNNVSRLISTGTTSPQMSFYTGASERARIDSSGRLLVGTSSALTGTTTQYSKLVHLGNVAGGTSSGILCLGVGDSPSNVLSGYNIGRIFFTDNNAGEFASIVCQADANAGSGDYPGRLVFSTTADGAASPTERMRIKSNGHILLGCTSAPNPGAATTESGFAINGTGNDGYMSAKLDNGPCGYFRRDGTDGELFNFRKGSTSVGSISVTASATAYNTSSDYRLKENVTAVTDGITRLQQLKPSRFNFIADPDKTVDGFLAHEVQTIVPEAITGEKDAVDDEGNPQYQGIDQSKLVPLLTAALQEAIGRIEALEAEVAALKAQ